MFSTPISVPANPYGAFGFFFLGLCFRVLIGPGLPTHMKDVCCWQSADGLIFLANQEEQVMNAMARLLGSSIPVGKLAEEWN